MARTAAVGAGELTATDPRPRGGTGDASHHDMLDSITAKGLIKADMAVVSSDGREIAVVDHVQGTDAIKLAKDRQGRPHYIPLTWVSSVDDKVHIDRTSEEAVAEWSPTPAVDAEPGPTPRR
jgi:hypothetical protein